MEGRNRDMESVCLKKEIWKVWLKEGGSVQDKVEGRNRDMESVGLKKEETAYGTKWTDVIEI